ncbi:bifunctional adenosylcobinamide kinase/adenosylcobinamide-phosphate guanylyltransferase, partial [Mycobacterium kansasii]
MRTLVLGGIRSGKSRWAEDAIAAGLPPGRPVHYLAPGPAGADDAAWAHRVVEHRERRPAHWSTIEACDIATQLRQSADTPTLVDDLGTWLA